LKKIIFYLIFITATSAVFSQNFGIRAGMTTATLTGNYDAYDFDFRKSFSPGYKAGLVGNFELSNIIILKPELSYISYSIKQKINNDSAIYNLEQSHNIIGVDLNFDVKLPGHWSVVFGMGFQYLVFKNNQLYINNSSQALSQSVNDSVDHNSDPFANINICYTIRNTILIDLEYRHLLDNWGVSDFTNENELVNADNRSVKLHMINISAAILF
tara:strand:+ start:200 stop:841 length:642 start_codon:yes stop_codon:yes gene_type:complete